MKCSFKNLQTLYNYLKQNSHTGMTETYKELQTVKSQNREMEKLIKQLREDLDIVHMQLEKEKSHNQELSEQVNEKW